MVILCVNVRASIKIIINHRIYYRDNILMLPPGRLLRGQREPTACSTTGTKIKTVDHS